MGTVALTFEIMRAIVAKIDFLSARKPAFTLPNIALSLGLLDEGHPPINTDKHR